MKSEDLKICVATITFRRPKTLDRLLTHLASLSRPKESNFHFLIVDNDPHGSASKLVDSYRETFKSGALHYVIECEPGIPAARNRALAEAIQSGSDLLCFTDDDAWPDSHWLVNLVSCYRAEPSVLVFGPQRLVTPRNLRSTWKRFIGHGLEARSRFVERFAARHGRKGRVVTSGTYNWLGDLQWIKGNEINFATELKHTGGSDTAFREKVITLGGKISWCPGAVVYEEVPPERLRLRYQFKRARMQGINAEHAGRQAFPRILRSSIGRMAVGVALIIFPIVGRASFMLGVHLFGMAVGIIQARRGVKSELYARRD